MRHTSFQHKMSRKTLIDQQNDEYERSVIEDRLRKRETRHMIMEDVIAQSIRTYEQTEQKRKKHHIQYILSRIKIGSSAMTALERSIVGILEAFMDAPYVFQCKLPIPSKADIYAYFGLNGTSSVRTIRLNDDTRLYLSHIFY